MQPVGNAIMKCCVITFTLLLAGAGSGTAVDLGQCVKFFKYVKKSGVWCGILSVPVPQSGLPLKVQLEMSLKGLLKSKYVGVIELLEGPEELFERILADRVKTVEYNVLFPMPFPVPIISSVKVNGDELCKGTKVSGSVVTNIKLQHEFPTNYYTISSEYVKSYYGSADDCGEYVSRDNIEKVESGEDWPWLVAILVKESPDSLRFHCTGTVVSRHFVLTAAHCFANELKLNSTDMVLYFGKHDLSKWGEKNSQVAEVKRVFLHPQFNMTTLSSDLALVQLLVPIAYTKFVKPLCLWQGKTSLNEVIGKDGLLVGWGKDVKSDNIKPKPRMVELPIVAQEDCLRSQIDFHYVTSTRTFCAGKRNGKGPCNGDSGSALIYPNYERGLNYWHLRGIISLSLYDKVKHTCDLSQYAVFTDVAKYMLWITTILKSQD